MMALLLALALCWDPNTEPDLSHYRVRFAERYITAWVACPSPEDPDALCPEYSPFAWAWYSVDDPEFISPPCADTSGGVCFYSHPTAVDIAGNESAQPMLLWPPPVQGGCP
jgi:hypothetical protein